MLITLVRVASTFTKEVKNALKKLLTYALFGYIIFLSAHLKNYFHFDLFARKLYRWFSVERNLTNIKNVSAIVMSQRAGLPSPKQCTITDN